MDEMDKEALLRSEISGQRDRLERCGDEIERLRAENEQLRAELESAKQRGCAPCWSRPDE